MILDDLLVRINEEDIPWNEEPASREEATAQLAELGAKVLDINVQLATRKPIEEVSEEEEQAYKWWKRRAAWAKYCAEKRLMFLRGWIKEQGAPPPSHRDRQPLPDGVTSTRMLRLIAKRVGYLEAVYVASRRYVEEDTDEAWTELLRALGDATTALEQAEDQS